MYLRACVCMRVYIYIAHYKTYRFIQRKCPVISLTPEIITWKKLTWDPVATNGTWWLKLFTGMTHRWCSYAIWLDEHRTSTVIVEVSISVADGHLLHCSPHGLRDGRRALHRFPAFPLARLATRPLRAVIARRLTNVVVLNDDECLPTTVLLRIGHSSENWLTVHLQVNMHITSKVRRECN